jgi:hypothetical protein
MICGTGITGVESPMLKDEVVSFRKPVDEYCKIAISRSLESTLKCDTAPFEVRVRAFARGH